MIDLQAIAASEQSLIGAIVRDNTVLDSLRVEPGHMTTMHARVALEAAVRLRLDGTAFDEIVLYDAMSPTPVDLGYLTAAGIQGAPLYVAEYEAAILAFQRKRRFLELMDEAKRMVAQHGLEHAMGEVIDGINSIDTGSKSTSVGIAKAVSDLIRSVEQNQDKARGLPSGVQAFDLVTGGFRQGIVSIVAARPAMGKSSFGLAIARANALAGNGVHVFTLEDSQEMYAARFIARSARVETDKFMAAKLNREQMSNMASLKARLKSDVRWRLDESTPERPDELVRRVRSEAAKNGTKIVIVDYLQIIAGGMDDARNEHDAISKCMHVFQQAAKRDNMAYVVMCQLNRKAEERPDKRPVLSDLRGSGTIEEKGKLIVGMYRGAYYHDEPIRGIDYPANGYPPSADEFKQQVKLCIIKNSSGMTCEVDAAWKGEFCEIT